MVLPTILAYASIATLLVAIGFAIDRRCPIFQVLAPVKSFRAFCWLLVIAGAVCLLGAWQLFGESLLFGQQPMTWAMAVILIYAWACLAVNVGRGG